MENPNESGTPPASEAPAGSAQPTPSIERPSTRAAQSADPVPTKGRVVMYYAHVNDQIVEHTAHVVQVWGTTPDACVNLAVFDENGQLYAKTSVSRGGPDKPGTWNWPRRAS